MGIAIRLRAVAVGLALGLAGPAWAQDDDWDFDDLGEDDSSDESTDDAPAPAPTADEAPARAEDPDDDEWIVEPESEEGSELDFEDDLFAEDSKAAVQGPGEDTAKLYRAQLDEVEDFGADEEALAWERYLKKYPNSIFKARIEARLDELNEELYQGRIDTAYTRTADAGKAELYFAQPMQLESIDPRSKLRAGFEWGIPNYINLMADLEYQLFRELSVHGGIRNRFTGWNVEVGGKYALVKSARLQMLVTAMADVRLNLDPAFPGLRPQLGVGKRFQIGSAKLDVMAQGGSDMALINTVSGDTVFSPRLVGGANVTLIPSETVRAFVETSSYMKGFGEEAIGPFRFNQLTFGLKFVQRKTKTEDRFETGVGASAPYTSNYWRFHQGSIMGDVNYYL